MKLLSLNINKFNYDVTKHSVLSYVRFNQCRFMHITRIYL